MRETAMSEREASKVPTKETVYSFARHVFGEPSKAFSWMNTPNPILQGMCPKDFIEYSNEGGLKLVMDELGRIEQGIF
jgi:uncharacterized protein (DUF2384 family)